MSPHKILTILLASQAAALCAGPFLEKMDLFENGKGGYTLYRIPGIVVTRKGTVLAYTEARKNDQGDWGPIEIYLRRSEDGGKTWDLQKRIAQIEGPIHKNPVALAQKLGVDGEVTYNNPVAIADWRTGAIHFLFCVEYMRTFYMRSDDEGKTFSHPVEITSAFEGFRKLGYDWKVLATGPGHGIQLSNGRLVAPVWISLGTGGHAHRPSVSSVIYSDDSGKTWRNGEIAIPNTEDYVYPSEATIVQLADGRVLLNGRTESNANRRLFTYSKDGATGWSKPVFQAPLLEPICEASMIRLTTQSADSKNRLLFANPDNLGRADGKVAIGASRDRRNLTIKMSYDEAGSWPVSKPLDPGWSGYSDLAAGKDGTIFCLYERGGLGGDHFKTAALTLAKFNLEWLTDSKDSLTGKAR